QSHRSGFSWFAKNPVTRSDARLFRIERSSGRLSLERLFGLPRRLCERSLTDEFRLVEQVRTSRPQFHRRRIDPKSRARTSGHPSVHALDPIEPMYELSHAQG